MLVFLCITILVIASLMLTLKGSVAVDIDVLKRCGKFCVKAFGVTVFCRTFLAEDNFSKIEIEASTKKTQTINSGRAVKSMGFSLKKILDNPIIKKVDIPVLDVGFSIGAQNDAFLSIMGFSMSRIILYSLFAFMKTRYNSAITSRLTPCFSQSCLSLNLYSMAEIQIIDLITGLFLILKHKLKKLVSLNRKLKEKAKKQQIILEDKLIFRRLKYEHARKAH